MCTTNQLQKILTQLSQIYHDIYGKDIVQIILYGSYARGDHQKDSDIDVVAIVIGDREDLQKKLKEVWNKSSDLELEYDTIISPTVIPFDEFEKYKKDIPYYANIAKEGVQVPVHKLRKSVENLDQLGRV